MQSRRQQADDTVLLLKQSIKLCAVTNVKRDDLCLTLTELLSLGKVVCHCISESASKSAWGPDRQKCLPIVNSTSSRRRSSLTAGSATNLEMKFPQHQRRGLIHTEEAHPEPNSTTLRFGFWTVGLLVSAKLP